LKGHGFSRAADGAEKSRALAPEGKLNNGQYSVMKQLPGIREPLAKFKKECK
jgi:hypothetical protein